MPTGPANRAPTVGAETARRKISENSPAGSPVGEPLTTSARGQDGGCRTGLWDNADGPTQPLRRPAEPHGEDSPLTVRWTSFSGQVFVTAKVESGVMIQATLG